MSEENKVNGVLSFGQALEHLKEGRRMARLGWNGADMFIFLVEGSKFQVNRAPLDQFYPHGTEVEYRPHVDMRAADGTIGVWLCSQSDMLATDWVIVEQNTQGGAVQE